MPLEIYKLYNNSCHGYSGTAKVNFKKNAIAFPDHHCTTHTLKIIIKLKTEKTGIAETAFSTQTDRSVTD